MMNRLLTILSFLLFFSFVQAQDLLLENENSGNQVRQKIGTENVLREYFKSVSSAEDTLYVALYRPRLCPRCEDGIKAFNEALHNEGKEVVLLSVLNDSVLAKDYAKQRGFDADYFIYDTEKKYLEWLNFNTADLFDVYFLKVCSSSGRLITGVNADNATPPFFKQLFAREQPMEMHDYVVKKNVANNKKNTMKAPAGLKPLNIKKNFDIDTAAKQLTLIYGSPSLNERYLVFTDDFAESTLVFERNNSVYTFKYEIKPTAEEKKRFVSVSDEIYKELDDDGGIYYFSLSPHIVSNDTLAVSFSLPLVWYDNSEPSSTKRIGLANAPTILRRILSTGKALDPIDIFPPDDNYFLSHFDFSLFNDMIVLQNEKKTWPIISDSLKYKNQECCDPFMEEFYDNDDNFTLAAIDINTGKVVKRFGNLESFQKKTLTGTFFTNLIYSVNGNQLIYGNGYGGKLYLTDYEHLGEVLELFEIFHIDEETLPTPDKSMLYTYEHTSQYNDLLSRTITNVEFSDRYIYCLQTYVDNNYTERNADVDADHVFTVFDRKTKTCKEYIVPRLSGTPLGFGLSKDNNCVEVIAVYSDNGYKLYTFAP